MILLELKKLIELIKQHEINLIVTQQVLDEFYRNRESKLKDAFKRLSDLRFSPSIVGVVVGAMIGARPTAGC